MQYDLRKMLPPYNITLHVKCGYTNNLAIV